MKLITNTKTFSSLILNLRIPLCFGLTWDLQLVNVKYTNPAIWLASCSLCFKRLMYNSYYILKKEVWRYSLTGAHPTEHVEHKTTKQNLNQLQTLNTHWYHMPVKLSLVIYLRRTFDALCSLFLFPSMDMYLLWRFLSWLGRVLLCGLHFSGSLLPTIWHAHIKSDSDSCYWQMWKCLLTTV